MLHLDQDAEFHNYGYGIQTMRVKAIFFAPFRELFGADEINVDLDGTPNVKSLLDLLCNSNTLREKIFNEFDELRSDLTVLKNGRSIQTINGVQTELKEGDEIAIFPPIAGG